MRSLSAAFAVLSLFCLTGALGWTDFHALNPNHKRTELPDGRIHLSHDVHHVFPESGTFFTAKYDAIHDKKWHFVELHQHADFLGTVDCGASDKELFVKTPSKSLMEELSKQNYEWTVLTSHQKFHCSETAIFRGVLGTTYHKDTDTLQIHTVQFNYNHVFEHLDYDQDTDHLHHQSTDEADVEWDNNGASLPPVEEDSSIGLSEFQAGHAMQQQGWWSKLKKAVKKVVKKAKAVVVKAIKKVIEPIKTIAQLLTGTFEKSKHWGIKPMNFNKNVAKKFDKYNFNGDFKLAVSASCGAGIRLRISIKRFKFIIAEAYYYGEFAGGVRASFNGRYKYDNSRTKQLANIHVATITFAIGPVPVVIIITVPINAGYDLDVDGRMTLNFLLSAEGRIKQGLRLTRSRGFEVINEKYFRKVRDFSPRAFRFEVGLSAFVQVNLKANVNFIGGVQAGIQITGEALMQINSKCLLLLQINLHPIITAGAQIYIGYKNIKIYSKNWGPKALVSWKIPLLNYCIPKTRTSRRIFGNEHQMALQAASGSESTNDATQPFNHHPVQDTETGSLDNNSTGITWFGDSSCPNHPAGPMTMVFSMQFLPGNLTDETQIILTAAQNVTTVSSTEIDPETGASKYTYEMNNIQQTYYMIGELTPGFDGNMTHLIEEDPEEQYEANTTDAVKPVIALTIFVKVDPKDSTDITVVSNEMFCGSVKLYARRYSDDNSTFVAFSGGGGAPEESLYEKLKAYAIYVPILCVVILAIVVVVVVVMRRRSPMHKNFEVVTAEDPIMEVNKPTTANDTGSAHDARVNAL